MIMWPQILLELYSPRVNLCVLVYEYVYSGVSHCACSLPEVGGGKESLYYTANALNWENMCRLGVGQQRGKGRWPSWSPVIIKANLEGALRCTSRMPTSCTRKLC